MNNVQVTHKPRKKGRETRSDSETKLSNSSNNNSSQSSTEQTQQALLESNEKAPYCNSILILLVSS